ncbi:ORF49 [Xestia c-nigrum granulovirus]|uniref:ORF49 n=1 Tax=Xestia c-nigrum granulosis virus TaxID=51677 RepID=Q9PYZ4_GVXN|nr:ORF49 [Xestia c-nigrum granulovirus]AAF05163.1 ORF49 [Xestia c-nigrum granulovirus]
MSSRNSSSSSCCKRVFMSNSCNNLASSSNCTSTVTISSASAVTLTGVASFAFLRGFFFMDRNLASISFCNLSRLLICSSVKALSESSKMDLICLSCCLSVPSMVYWPNCSGFDIFAYGFFVRFKGVMSDGAFSYHSISDCVICFRREPPPYFISSLSTYDNALSVVPNKFSLGRPLALREL